MKTMTSLCLLLFSAVHAHVSWAQSQASQPDFVNKYEAVGVPAPLRTFDFDSEKSFPLPANTTSGGVAFTVKAQPLSEKESKAFAGAIKAVTASKQLAAILGSASRLLSGGELPRAKSAKEDDPAVFKFTYYDYAKEQAIEAYVSVGKVTQIRERELGFQPTVSDQELFEAARILSKHTEIPVPVESLRGLAQSGPDGKRQVHVFTENVPNGPTSAVIDIYGGNIVEWK